IGGPACLTCLPSLPGAWITRRKEANAERFLRAQQRLSRWGAPALLLTWVPSFVGVRPLPFVFFTTLGKGLRYAVVLGSALAAAEAVR
ncbi:MAG: hypothetical protein M3Y59_26215, partial [Myxococcota bacterium]|nr:hypothetical protein [Myxococcota bacterium]